MNSKLMFTNIIAFVLILMPLASAAFYTNLQDDWDWDTGTEYDNNIWDDYEEGEYGTILEIRGEDWSGDDADAVCLDFDQQDGDGFDYCYYDGTDEECDIVSSTFNNACNQGCQGDYSGGDIEVTNRLDYDGHDVVYARMYFDCDESEGDYYYEDDYEWYYDYDARRTDCYSSGSDTFYHEAKDEYDESWYIFSTHYCSSEHNSYWGCATWDEETDYTPEDAFDEDPCKIKDGTEEGNECDYDIDCVSQDCDGAQTVYEPTCWYDGADDYNLNVDIYSDTCGGSGHNYDSSDDDFTCSQYLGSAYVCDADLDGGNTNDPADFCRKDFGESCSQDSDCWDDNGGYDCNSGYCSKCGNNYCTHQSESASSCPQDCCDSDCSDSAIEGQGSGTGECFSECEGYAGCSYYNSATRSACDGEDKDEIVCVDEDTYVTCCESTPSNCPSNKYCSGGSCLTCNTECNDNCQSSACYGDDPDCDSGGDVNGNCGDGICCQETSVSCPQDCSGEVNYCNGTIEVIVEDLDGNGINNSKIYLNDVYNTSITNAINAEIDIENAVCGNNYNVSVYCPDDSTFCDSEMRSADTSQDHDSILFNCDICRGKRDLWIESSEITITNQDGQSNVSILVHSSNVSASNVQVNIFTSQIVNITIPQVNPFSTYSVSGLIDLSNQNFVRIFVDASDIVDNEVDEGNNFVEKLVNPQVNAYVEVDTDLYPVIDDEIKEYIQNYINPVSADSAQVLIYIGRKAVDSDQNAYTLNNLDWGIKNFNVKYKDKSGGLPYVGLVGRFTNPSDQKTRIFAYGNRIDGDIAAAKHLISEAAKFLDASNLKRDEVEYIGKDNIEAIKVFDYFHNEENILHYMQNSYQFTSIINKALRNSNYETFIKLVKTLSGTSYSKETILRVKHLSPQLQTNLKNYTGISSTPVVFSGGIFSNLFAWEGGLASEMAKEGWDIWEMEIMGGPQTDCDDCPDYTYGDQVDYFWPASIAGILEYSDKNQVDFVGHSGGCRAALSSLNEYSSTGKNNAGYYFNDDNDQFEYADLDINPVGKFIGVACPGVLNDGSYFVDSARAKIGGFGPYLGDFIVDDLLTEDHVTMKDFATIGVAISPPYTVAPMFVFVASLITGDIKISKNLLKYYKDLAIDEDSTLDLSGVDLDELHLFYTKYKFLGLIPTTHDILVPYADMGVIYNATTMVSSSNKSENLIPERHHSSIKNDQTFKKEVKEVLK